MRFTLQQLEQLVMIERLGSLSAAARELGVTQPYLSRTVKQMESRCGFALFERDRSGARPTGRGMEVLARARAVVDEMRSLERLGRDPAPSTLRLDFYAVNAAEIMVRLDEARPGLTTTLEHVQPKDALDRLRRGTADAFVGLRLPHVEWPEEHAIVVQQVAVDPTVVFLPLTHRLAGATEIDLAELADDDWITGEDAASRRMLLVECRAAGFEPRMRYFTFEGGLVRSLLSSGRAVALGSSVAPRGPGFVAKPYRNATPAVWTLARRADRDGDQVLTAVADATRSVFEAMRQAARAHDTAEGAG